MTACYAGITPEHGMTRCIPNGVKTLTDHPEWVAVVDGKRMYDYSKPNGAEKRVTAALIALSLGTFGFHKFYLGYTKEAVIHLVISLITCRAAGSIIGLIEGIIYLTKSDEEFVATYIQNQKGWF